MIMKRTLWLLVLITGLMVDRGAAQTVPTSVRGDASLTNCLVVSGRNGTKLYTVLFEELKEASFHRAYANITLPNPASVALHERFGFTHEGTLHEVGRKFKRFHDVATYEKHLDG